MLRAVSYCYVCFSHGHVSDILKKKKTKHVKCPLHHQVCGFKSKSLKVVCKIYISVVYNYKLKIYTRTYSSFKNRYYIFTQSSVIRYINRAI